jgi:hypothetical protein
LKCWIFAFLKALTHESRQIYLRSTVSRRNLGTANERRNCKIFEEFAYVLIAEARRSCYLEDFEIEVDRNVYTLDSTTIDLCLNIFWWAEFRKHNTGNPQDIPYNAGYNI